MAKVTATVFKAQVALMATALTTAWNDDTLTEVAADFKDPKHPLRDVLQLFTFNAKDGLVSSNDGYIDAAYAGKYPSVPTRFGVKAD